MCIQSNIEPYRNWNSITCKVYNLLSRIDNIEGLSRHFGYRGDIYDLPRFRIWPPKIKYVVIWCLS